MAYLLVASSRQVMTSCLPVCRALSLLQPVQCSQARCWSGCIRAPAMHGMARNHPWHESMLTVITNITHCMWQSRLATGYRILLSYACIQACPSHMHENHT